MSLSLGHVFITNIKSLCDDLGAGWWPRRKPATLMPSVFLLTPPTALSAVDSVHLFAWAPPHQVASNLAETLVSKLLCLYSSNHPCPLPASPRNTAPPTAPPFPSWPSSGDIEPFSPGAEVSALLGSTPILSYLFQRLWDSEETSSNV